MVSRFARIPFHEEVKFRSKKRAIRRTNGMLLSRAFDHHEGSICLLHTEHYYRMVSTSPNGGHFSTLLDVGQKTRTAGGLFS